MLAAEHQSIFQRLWNDIKRLCKLATAGSKEAKALAKVEKAFADAYRKASKIVSKTKFNLNETVEETKDLLALHNITSNQLKGTLERGSLIMPSLALTNKSFSDFGEISLIFKKSSVDPTVNKKNKLYGADAWTAAEPNLKKNPIFNEGKTSEIVDKIKSDIGKEHVAELFDVTYEQFKTAIKNADGDIFGPYIHNLGMQTAYAMEKGIITDIPTRVDGTVDVEKLKELLDAELDTDNGWRKYKRWLNRISDSIITSYDVASNEDLLQNMKKQPETAKPFKLSEDGSLVVPAVEYTSIDEVRRNKGRLSENASEATKAVGGEFLTLAKRIGDNSHIGTKNIVTAINKAFADRYSVKNIIKAFADNGITLSQKNASELQNLYKKAVELPTQYFEAKPGREVDFEEAAVFVIPNDLDANLKQQLLDKGYDIAEYDPSVEGDRQNVVNSFEEYKFSLSAKAEKSTDTKSDGVRYAINQNFYNEFDAWDKENPSVSFTIGNTSEALKSIGMKNQEITMRSGMIISKLNKHPEMSVEKFRQIPELLENPVIIQFSDAIDHKTGKPKYDSRITVLGELCADMTVDGKIVQKPILVSLELLPTNQKKTVVLDISVVTSAYAKGAIQEYINNNSILYIDPNKKRTNKWLSLNRLQLPVGENQYGSVRRITYSGNKVKIENSKNKSDFQVALEKAGVVDTFGNIISKDERKNSLVG